MNGPRKKTCQIAALMAGTMLSFSSQSTAQQLPQTISPLQVVSDLNGVNLATGKEMPQPVVLSIPAAPRLKFDNVQNAAPYINGQQFKSIDGGSETGAWTVHTSDGVSEAFRCSWDMTIPNGKECGNVNGSGSALNFTGTLYRRSGSGELYSLNVIQTFTNPPPSNPDQRLLRQFYVSQIAYPDGELITYSYDTTTWNSASYFRPNKISTNRGYYIAITYQSSDITQSGWGMPATVAIYAASDTNGTTPLAKLTYSNETATDLAGRVYQGVDGGQLGNMVEIASFSETLPTESTPAVVLSPATGLPTSAQMIGTVSRDGVAWNYSYANPTMCAGCQDYNYSSITVTGPNFYHTVYSIAEMGSVNGPGIRNMVTARTDELNRTTTFNYDTNTLQLTSITLPEGNSTSVTYDGVGNVITKTSVAKSGSGLANLTEQAFVDLSAFTNSNGYVDCTTTALCWRPKWYKDALTRETDFTYNSNGQLTQQLDPADQSGVRRETDITYAASPAGISRKTLVRICGQTTTCSGTAESHTEYTYWGDTDLPLTVTLRDEASGATRTTTYAYDNAGRMTMADGPLTGTDDAKYFQYDVLGRKIWEVDELAPNGLRLARKYTYRDSDDKVTSVQSGTVACVAACNTANLSLSLQQQTDTTYDSRRNPIRQRLFLGATTYSATDSSFLDRGLAECVTVRMNLSNLPTTTDHGACSLGTQGSAGPDRTTYNSYDTAGELTLVQKAYGITTANGFPQTLQANYAAYSYTPNGKQQFVTDANENKAQFVYDGFDRLYEWQFPDPNTAGAVNAGDFEQYTYDSVGNRTCLRKRSGAKLTFTFDGLNRMTSKLVAATSGGTCP